MLYFEVKYHYDKMLKNGADAVDVVQTTINEHMNDTMSDWVLVPMSETQIVQTL